MNPQDTTRARPVELVANSYQTPKAELEEEIDLTPLEGKTPDEPAAMVLAPVDLTTIPQPRE